ncbi:MAG: hypothetical protein Q8P18_07725 [Pseudomonadota bacterium]|nr:hypothetical protein [Pseudomonadota bacterium]
MATRAPSPAFLQAWRVLGRTAALLSACLLGPALLPSLPPEWLPPGILGQAWAGKRNPELPDYRDAAAASGNYGLALAYDDAISGQSGFRTEKKWEELSANRQRDFAGFVAAEMDKIGPLTDSNAEATFGVLLALVREARRGEDRRIEDLAPVLAGTLQPLMDEAAVRMWAQVEALISSHEYIKAAQLGEAVVAAAPGDGRYATRLGEARLEAAGYYAGLGRNEPAGAPGARLVDARMAALFGGPGPDTLTAELAAIAALADVAWETDVAGTCGDLPKRLTSGFNKNQPGQPTRLSIRLDSCGLEPHAFTTHESIDYTVIEHHTEIREVYHPGQECVTTTVNVGSDCVTEGGTTTCTPDNRERTDCTDTSYTTQESFDVAEEHTYTESYDVQHRDATASTSGSFRVDWEGGTREVPFQLAANSGDDKQYTSEHAGRRSFDYGSESAAYSNLSSSLAGEIGRTRTEVQAARAALVLAQARAAASSGQDAEAAHLFWVGARQIGTLDPEFLTWGQAHYAVPASVFDAALAGRPLPGRAFEAVGVALPTVDPDHVMAATMKSWNGNKQWERRQRIMATVGLGVSTAREPADAAWQVNTPLIAGAATLFIGEKDLSWAVLARIAYGNNFAGSRISEIDVGVGAALNIVGFSVMPFIGLGYGNMVGILPVPSAAQIEYGLRLGVAFPPEPLPISIDLIYTKTGRTSEVVPEEQRLDFRAVYSPVSLTFRYSQYLSPQDKWYQFFSDDTRVGSAIWVLAGVGI